MLKNRYNVVAVMSGTSLDGLDVIYVTFDYLLQWNFKIKYVDTIPYSEYWCSILERLIEMPKERLTAIDVEYSTYTADIILQFIRTHRIETLDFIASHGHTALHQPDKGITYQIGNHQIFADRLQRKVICDFRVQDVLFGGQGAPLVPIGDKLLFSKYEYCLNLGGFANISFENKGERVAFDICPVNVVLNYYVLKLNFKYDDKGQIASKGKVNIELLNRLNGLKFYRQCMPKSLGLEWVNRHIFPLINSFDLSVKDVLRTFVEHVAIQISKHTNIIDAKVLVTGGGAYNDFLIERLTALTISKIIIPHPKLIEYKEALIFGLLGVLKDRNEVNCLKSVTGVNENHSSGKILIPQKRN